MAVYGQPQSKINLGRSASTICVHADFSGSPQVVGIENTLALFDTNVVVDVLIYSYFQHVIVPSHAVVCRPT